MWLHHVTTKLSSHISKQRIIRFVSDGILNPLNISYFKVYMEYVKGKQKKNQES